MSFSRPRFLAHSFREGIGTQRAHQQAQNAAFERYGVIHSFFKQQHRRVPSPKNPQQPTLPGYRISYGGSLLARSAFSVGRFPARALHTTNALLKQERPSRPSPPNLTETYGRTPEEPHQDAKHEAEEIEDNSRVPDPLDNYPAFLRRLAMSVPNIHKPTRDDLLTVADGFWQRARIRFRWFTIKSFRKFDADDISAFVTWFLMSQTIWILVGT
jgi:distribution and morphology protein 31